MAGRLSGTVDPPSAAALSIGPLRTGTAPTTAAFTIFPVTAALSVAATSFMAVRFTAAPLIAAPTVARSIAARSTVGPFHRGFLHRRFLHPTLDLGRGLMVLARAWSIALFGMDGITVEIEADIGGRKPKTTIFGSKYPTSSQLAHRELGTRRYDRRHTSSPRFTPPADGPGALGERLLAG